MKWTKFFIPTSKEVPADAHVPSHQLMVRCGMIRQVVAGSYTYLPIGYRTLRKIEAIVREEINAAGGIELHMPALHPIEWMDHSRFSLKNGWIWSDRAPYVRSSLVIPASPPEQPSTNWIGDTPLVWLLRTWPV